MGKKDDLITRLKPILDDRKKLEGFLIENSNLPGPRANIELAFALAEVYYDKEILFEWANITEDQADVNNPESFLAFCSAACLGKIYTLTRDTKIIAILMKLANDGRWRMREAVAFGFQYIGEHDFEELKKIISAWITGSNNLEKRAMLASLAHPGFLNEERTEFCFEITEKVLQNLETKSDFDVLRKGLEFTISVFVVANPELGFRFIRKWIGKDKFVDKILQENLKKNRLIKAYPEEVRSLMNEF
jgi:hypothetical protein